MALRFVQKEKTEAVCVCRRISPLFGEETGEMQMLNNAKHLRLHFNKVNAILYKDFN